MGSQELLPKRVVAYIREIGIRSLDHLSDEVLQKTTEAGDRAYPDALQSLVGRWNSMATEEKEAFIDHVSASVIEVMAASAALPVGLKTGRKAAKATRKVIKRQAKKLKKAAAARKSANGKEPDKKAKSAAGKGKAGDKKKA